MIANFRALLAALIVIVIAGVGMYYVGHRSHALAGRGVFDVATTGNVSELFNGDGSAPAMMPTSMP